MFVYNVDNEIKQEFLNKKPTGTAKSNAYVLRSADEYEQLINKPIYNMSHAELQEMIAMQFQNGSKKTVETNVSILRTYIDYCISKNIVLHGENRLVTFTAQDSNAFVHKQALLNKYISREELRQYQNILFNEQDKLLLGLVFLGVRGRTTEGGTLEEIINLSINDLDESKRMITLKQNDGKNRRLELNLSTIELIKDTYKQEVYVENNGQMTNNPRLSKPREIKINHVEDYVFRTPGKNKFEKFTPNLLNSRMRRLQKWLDNPYLTYTSLYMSGMIQLAMDIYKEKGELSKEDIIIICDRYNYGGDNPEKYWFNVKALFEQYRELLQK